jgi:hypothetical protein
MRCITGQYKKPYSENKNLKFDFQVIIQTAKYNLRPSVHTSCPPPFTSLMQKCWEADPANRPTMQEALSSLLEIKNLFERERASRTSV